MISATLKSSVVKGGVVKVDIFYVDMKIALYVDKKNENDFKVDIEDCTLCQQKMTRTLRLT